MCGAILWTSAVCTHSYAYQPREDLEKHGPFWASHHFERSFSFFTACRECLAAVAFSSHEQLNEYLATFWSHELDSWRAYMWQRDGNDPLFVVDGLPERRSVTFDEYMAAGMAARSLAEHLLEAAESFNDGRARFVHKIQTAMDESPTGSGTRGEPGRWPDGESPLPALAPVAMYHDVLRYLDQWQERLKDPDTDMPAKWPEVTPW
ncbi:MAG: hypothetical protein M1826_001463 [Phylliscum demangeonii]|nr:MAG: hypothetical protein M1826_001463 [Phylliscum demangeonii]